VEQETSRGFRGGRAGRRSRHDFDGGLNRRLVTLDETKRLVAREDEFNRAHHDASKRIHARCVQSGGGGGVASHLGQA